jgi:hypothetical protein
MKTKYKVLTLTDKGLVSPIANKTYGHLGDWTKEVAKPVMCRRGWHLWDTRAAANEMFLNLARDGKKTVLMFAAEGKGYSGTSGFRSKKSLYKSIRLTKLIKTFIAPYA